MKLKDMTFVITDKCTAACKICCFSCSPTNNYLLDKATIKDYIAQLAENNSEAKAAFTGGEALIYRDMLLECMVHAKSRGLQSTLVTNCSFAKNLETARKVINELVAAGLTSMAVSVDEYHQEFVPVQFVKNVLTVALEKGIKVNIRMMELRDEDSIEKAIEELRPEIYGAKLRVYPIFPIGSAVKDIPNEKFIRLCPPKKAFCPSVRSITAMFNGDLLMCCSQFAYDIPIVKIGKFGETTLAEAIKNISRNDFVYVMYMNGLGWYAQMARQLGYCVDDKYCVACHLCYELFSNKEFVKQVAPFVEKEAEAIRLKKFFSARG